MWATHCPFIIQWQSTTQHQCGFQFLWPSRQNASAKPSQADYGTCVWGQDTLFLFTQKLKCDLWGCIIVFDFDNPPPPPPSQLPNILLEAVCVPQGVEKVSATCKKCTEISFSYEMHHNNDNINGNWSSAYIHQWGAQGAKYRSNIKP